MRARLARTVWVTPPGKAQRVRLPAGSTPPEWAWPLITNRAAWSVPPEAETVAERPPLHGKGSSRDAWAAYAGSIGVQVPDGASRADIIAAVEE